MSWLIKLSFVKSYQLKNAFDKLFDDLMEDKTREMEPAEVRAQKEHTAAFLLPISSISQLQMSLLMSVCTGGVHFPAPTSEAGALVDDLSWEQQRSAPILGGEEWLLL